MNMSSISDEVKTINVAELKLKTLEDFEEAPHFPFIEGDGVEDMYDVNKMQQLFDMMNYFFNLIKVEDSCYKIFAEFRCDFVIGEFDWTRSHDRDDELWPIVDNTLYRMATRLGIDISGEEW